MILDPTPWKFPHIASVSVSVSATDSLNTVTNNCYQQNKTDGGPARSLKANDEFTACYDRSLHHSHCTPSDAAQFSHCIKKI